MAAKLVWGLRQNMLVQRWLSTKCKKKILPSLPSDNTDRFFRGVNRPKDDQDPLLTMLRQSNV